MEGILRETCNVGRRTLHHVVTELDYRRDEMGARPRILANTANVSGDRTIINVGAQIEIVLGWNVYV